ncbi:sialidase family protein [Gimesia sp.]|uniref:sialidase family protein n=1 Tax=Gimesia sp. TaxID=2024833 RepID=UPI0025BEC2CD|nr:sialidase family protein [Gimesia sp.]|tara:strand:+ start:2138 stop:3412 length:1275 start_codon:yes stop_codon:yes gene_type:complete
MKMFQSLILSTMIVISLLVQTTMAAGPGTLSLKKKQMLKATSPLFKAIYQNHSGQEMIKLNGFSPDNGLTWEPVKPSPDFDKDLPYGYRRSPYGLWRDPVNGNILSLFNCMDTPDKDPKAHEPRWQWHWYYLRYRVSTDGGRTYLYDKPIVQKGKQYSTEHPVDGVHISKNCYFLGDLGCDPIRTREGTILVPMQMPPLANDGKSLHNPGGGWYWLQTRILIGRWTENNDIEWGSSEPIVGDGKRTVRGLYEPTLAQMPDGNIICIMRGSNGGKSDPSNKLPSRKWLSVSKDGGHKWSKPEPWTYSDGEQFFSPSSMSELITHSNGRTYWIGNISEKNCQANHPRWPLVIGEVDPKTYGIIRENLVVIDTKLPDEEDVNLSHWHSIEDRQTGNIVITTSRASKGYKSRSPVIYTIGVEMARPHE